MLSKITSYKPVIISLILSVIFALLIVMLSITTPDNTQSTAPQSTLSTIDTEHTAIAIFTKNPEFALSSTPYYVEIIVNDLIRAANETPLGTMRPRPTRSPSMTPVIFSQSEVAMTTTALVAQLTQTPVPVTGVFSPSPEPQQCNPAVANTVLDDKSRDIETDLKESEIEATVQLFSLIVEAIDGICESDLSLAASTNLSVYISTSSIDSDEIAQQILNILAVLADVDFDSPNIAPTINLRIDFVNKDDFITIQSDFHRALRALSLELRGADLIEYLNIQGG